MVDRYNLGGPDKVPEALPPCILQHACFTINKYLVHTDGMTNHQRRWGVQYDSAVCRFGEVVLADIKPITNKFDIRNKEEKIEGIWLDPWEKKTNSSEHIIATMDESGKAFYTRSFFLPLNIQSNQMTFFHHQVLNNIHQPDAYKPTHRLTGKQPPTIVRQLDDILEIKELFVENNEDKMEKTDMETIMMDVQVQPWLQYEDDITMFSETAVKEAMNKEPAQLLSKKSFEEINKDSLTPEQLQQVVGIG
eukprot:3243480-Amphidinium_carterae.1